MAKSSPVAVDPDNELDYEEVVSGKQHSLFERLYTGTGGFEIVGKRKMYYGIAAVLMAIAIASMAIKGFTLGIDFAGGSRIQLPAADGVTTSQVDEVYRATLGHDPVTTQKVGSGSSATIQLRSDSLSAEQADKLQNALFDAFHPKDSSGEPSRNAISVAEISETWGGQVTHKALLALVVFVALTMVYIAIRFERDMSIAAIGSLFFNLIVTAGIYSLVGFEVTPAAVIGLLTILGYVLYDNVVVFDKVEANTRGVLHLTKHTYAEKANLAANQTLMRSINTTVIGILPIIGMLVIAVWLLGVGTLKDLALVQLVGMIVGGYSSIFFAVPLLVSLKETWGPVAAHTKKVLARRSGAGSARVGAAAASRAGAAARGSDAVANGLARDHGPRGQATGAPRPGARPSGKRQKRRH
ncbi:protein translocase subunit SecF [Nocardia seriolae]|uniref:Protein-export membrane protein SecF n=1 Tax=Nocardia seriolae TaxID=37332 RepID=A0ABC8AZB2_9NOCA|nr:protein translocase subunit SecF [Nocardia seriolae]APA99644.1 Protein translocase subunit SecF [Nocardia seriolae]MTJ64213.1 protein translocase subunit SecF [Nocardia seriolae]MTJ73906.1 protein translocase subunit SecF [Nocardia seriolae]MTJ89206.1 protein translocase subunit SecF [Nocardia seriolae]MTK33184.1 protein translocase subunit SecF [Nocardia seriolae]